MLPALAVAKFLEALREMHIVSDVVDAAILYAVHLVGLDPATAIEQEAEYGAFELGLICLGSRLGKDMKKPKLIAGVFALALLPAVLVLVNRPSAVQAQSALTEAAAPWRIVQVPPKVPASEARHYPPVLLINTATGETWELYCAPDCRWLPVER